MPTRRAVLLRLALRTSVALALLGVGGCGAPGAESDSDDVREDSVQRGFVRDADFHLRPLDTGNQEQKCFVAAPWGAKSWGVEGSTFSDPKDHSLAASRFVAFGDQVYFYGKEDAGRWGFVRFIQGDAWGGTNCGPIPWNRSEPISTWDRDLRIDLDLYRDTTHLDSWFSSWAMLALNVWFSTPDLPEAGRDLNGRKPIVMDLIFHHECNTPGCGFGNYVDSAAYHYQAFIEEAPAHAWTSFSVPLSEHLQRAIEAFGIPDEAARTMKLYQLEILFELKNAEGAASVDRLELVSD